MGKPMHPTMERIYSAAIDAKLVTRDRKQSDMAELLGVQPQNVNNWESRGPSQPILLTIQSVTRINATWAVTGEGPRFVGEVATPPLTAECLAEMKKRGKDWFWVEGLIRSALELAPLTRPPLQEIA